MRRTALIVTLFGTATWLGVAAQSSSTPEVWVLNHESADIRRISTSTDGPIGSPIDVSDPDNDLMTEKPWDMEVSTLRDQGGRFVFVTQENLLTVVDANVPGIVRVHDVAGLIGAVGLDLRGVSAAVPMEFRDPTGGPAQYRSLLHVTGTRANGDVVFVVLDQDVLVATAGNPLVDWGRLQAAATAHDVVALDTPGGSAFQRAWYTVSRAGGNGDELLAVRIETGATLPGAGSFAVAETKVIPLGAGRRAPDHLKPSRSHAGELAVVPLSTLGRLDNLDTAGSCNAGTDLVASLVVGAGVGSHTVLAVDQTADALHVVNPRSCLFDTYATGERPVDLVALGHFFWRSVYTANRDSDSLTRLDEDGTVTPIPLATGGPPCTLCPIAVVVPFKKSCGLFGVNWQPNGPDMEVSWNPLDCDVSPGETQWVWCTYGGDDVNHDCYCDCNAPLDPINPCSCGQGPEALTTGIGGSLEAVIPDQILGNPWKRLGSSTDGTYTHPGGAVGDDSQFYGVSQSEDEPPGLFAGGSSPRP